MECEAESCWFGDLARRAQGEQGGEDFATFLAQHHQWQAYATAHGLAPTEVAELRRWYYGAPPASWRERVPQLGWYIVCFGALASIAWPILSRVVPTDAQPWLGMALALVTAAPLFVAVFSPAGRSAGPWPESARSARR